jgi:hypothetical protein
MQVAQIDGELEDHAAFAERARCAVIALREV